MSYSNRFLYVDTSYGIVNSLAVSGGPFDDVQSRKVLDDFAKINGVALLGSPIRVYNTISHQAQLK